VKVPKPHMIIKPSSGHSMTFGIDSDTGDTFCMALDSGKLIDRNSQLFERNLLIILFFIIILVIIFFIHLWFLQFLRLLELNFLIFRRRLLENNFSWTDHFSIDVLKVFYYKRMAIKKHILSLERECFVIKNQIKWGIQNFEKQRYPSKLHSWFLRCL
jgi:hypothetical protein